jgi:hypothetical protein
VIETEFGVTGHILRSNLVLIERLAAVIIAKFLPGLQGWQ